MNTRLMPNQLARSFGLLIVVMAATIALGGFARPAPADSADKILLKICRADGSPIPDFYLATVNVLERRAYRTGPHGTMELVYQLDDDDARWLVIRAFHTGGVPHENQVRDDDDPLHLMRRLLEVSASVHVPGEILIPRSVLDRRDEGVIEVRLPDAIVVKGSVRIRDRELEHITVYGEGRASYVKTKADGRFEVIGLHDGHSQRIYFRLLDGLLIARSIDAETAKGDVDLGVVELAVPAEPKHQINLSFRFPEPRSESAHAKVPGATLVRTDGTVMYALRSLMDGQSYPLIQTQNRAVAGTYYIYPSWSPTFTEHYAFLEAVLNGDDLSGYNLPTITVDEHFKPQEIDVADCVKRFEPLLEAYRRKRLEDQPVTITVVPRGGGAGE